jgi:SagB-type dehydrogenase family enzyme
MLSGRTLTAALLARRAVRHFADEPLPDGGLADLLFYSGGGAFQERVDGSDRALRKCVPSCGACHPVETYCAVRRSDQTPPGTYHYCVSHHALAQLATGPKFGSVDFIDELLAGQRPLAQAPVVFFFTCVQERLAWRYPVPRSYRAIHLECGHYCQNLLLVAADKGLGSCPVGFFDDALIEQALQLDGTDEFVMYAAVVGHPAG